MRARGFQMNLSDSENCNTCSSAVGACICIFFGIVMLCTHNLLNKPLPVCPVWFQPNYDLLYSLSFRFYNWSIQQPSCMTLILLHFSFYWLLLLVPCYQINQSLNVILFRGLVYVTLIIIRMRRSTSAFKEACLTLRSYFYSMPWLCWHFSADVTTVSTLENLKAHIIGICKILCCYLSSLFSWCI